jgi:protein ImuA
MSRLAEPGERHLIPQGAPAAERGSAASTDLLVARLREEIRRIERRPGRRDGIVACGLEAVDALLPGGGFSRGALAEISGGPASGKTAVALSLVARLGEGDLFAWVDGRGELYPPAAAARGVDLGRLLVVRPAGTPASPAEPPWRGALWACEAVLASGAFAAVVMDVPLPPAVPGADAVARRLQAAVERGGAVGLWLAAAGGGLRLPGAVRLELSSSGGRLTVRRSGGGASSVRAAEPRSAPGAPWGGGGRAA